LDIQKFHQKRNAAAEQKHFEELAARVAAEKTAKQDMKVSIQ